MPGGLDLEASILVTRVEGKGTCHHLTDDRRWHESWGEYEHEHEHENEQCGQYLELAPYGNLWLLVVATTL